MNKPFPASWRGKALMLSLVLSVPAIFAVDASLAASHGKKKAAPLETRQPAHVAPWTRYSDWPKTDWKDYNTLATLASPPRTDPPKLDGPIQGDPKKGAQLAFDRSRGGSCVACHVMGSGTPSLPGNVGPDLSTYGTWGRDDPWIFNYIYDPRTVNPESVMPPWGRHQLFSVDEIKDIVAFLKTLKEPAVFKDPLENPATRPLPRETRDNLDPFVNPAMEAFERGKRAFAEAGPRGQSCLSCHAAPEKAFRSWAAGMPKYEPRMQKVLNVEEFITRHARATTGADYPMQSDDNIALAIYLKNLANGQPFKVDTASAGAKEAAARGKALMQRKIGQLNFACIDCHSPEKGANKWIRGQWLTESRGQTAHFPTWRTSRSEIWDLRKRFQWCGVAIRANELPPDAPEYGDLELYLTSLNNGEKLSVPGIRH
ncbi:MAG: sulfur oxidation c-type cytochrome SoxA [Pseudomonadota bacterium]